MSGIERAPISKKLRFEVFKRDKFTCQYCGASAAQKLLHCDHVEPVAGGGETTLLNLITACVDCNLGKGDRPLSDETAMAKQHRQLAELEERRQQLAMMREWREELAQHQVDQISIVSDAFEAWSQFVPNEHGNLSVRRWLKKYGLAEVLAAIDETFGIYFTSVTKDVWEATFKRIPRMLAIGRQEKTDPHIRRLLYIQAILRNRLDDPHGKFVEKLRDAVNAGFSLDVLANAAKSADTWNEFVEAARKAHRRENPTPPPTSMAQKRSVEEMQAEIDAGKALARELRSILIDGLPVGQDERKIIQLLSNDAGSGGWYPLGENFGNNPDVIRALRGLQAVGLIVPAGELAEPDIVYRHDGTWRSSFNLHLPDPSDPSAFYNRFGAMRLSSFTPDHFSQVQYLFG